MNAFSSSVHGHIDLWGRGFVTPMEEQSLAVRLREEHPSLAFFCFSDLWLDHPETLDGLRRIFEACIENAFIPKVLILCGNFSSRGIAQTDGREIQRYQGSLLHIQSALRLIKSASRKF
jgi:DNA polymerase epsilon subunit 2